MVGTLRAHAFSNKKLPDRILNILGLLAESLRQEKDLFYDSQEILADLSRRGFTEQDVDRAILHLEESFLDIPGPFWHEALPTYRTYSEEETSRLPSRVRGYLWRLKCRGVIDHALEDEIVHKVMSLEDPAGLREIKTVAALTVFGYEHKARKGIELEPASAALLN